MEFNAAWLESIGIDAESIPAIMEAHEETVSALTEQYEAAKRDAEQVEALTKELEQLKTNGSDGSDWQSQYEAVRDEFAAFRAERAKVDAYNVKADLVRRYYMGLGFAGKSLDIMCMGSHREIDAAELVDGSIADYHAFAELARGVFAPLLGDDAQKVQGIKKPTKAEIMAIRDPVQRKNAINNNMELFI